MTLTEILEQDGPLRSLLRGMTMYWGHSSPRARPGERAIPPETLWEHVDLVNQTVGNLCTAHGLEPVIDRLIGGLVRGVGVESSQRLRLAIKRRFAYAILFHDFAKINPNYQFQRLQNPAFASKQWEVPFFPATGHAEAGAWLFVHYFLGETESETNNDILVFLDRMTVYFAYTIERHHAVGKFSITDFTEKVAGWGAKYAQFAPFLKQYGWPTEAPMKEKEWIGWTKELELETNGQHESGPDEFALHALLKLNYSLLTAADYLATSAYMSQEPVTEFGTISEELRARIIANARTTKIYNQQVFDTLSQEVSPLQFPEERDADHLNLLRRQMAVTALRTVDSAEPNQHIFYLEAPTGGGKTNISMLAAARLLERFPELNKLLYVFPFTTLATQTEAALREVYGLKPHEVAEIHSRAPLVQTDDPETDAKYGRERRNHLRYLFFHFPIALVTHIRFFDWLKTNWKESNYAYHRLANSVIILDEIQAYNPAHWDKVNYFLNRMAHYFNVRFIIMSATLPRLDELEFNRSLTEQLRPIALLPDARRYLTNPNFAQRVEFDFSLLYDERGRRRTIEFDELKEQVLIVARNYEALPGQTGVFVIVEFIFKKSAGVFARFFDKNDYFDEVLVLSGTVLEPQRRRVINYLKSEEARQKRVLLITTQVVEAGVDLDMDLGFKNTSLPDSDEQLAGRINRNVKKKRGNVLYLFHRDEPNVIYGKDYRYERMQRLGPEAHRDILQHKNFRRLYNEVFGLVRDIDKDDNTFSLRQYRHSLLTLDYKAVHDQFRLIEAENESIFVPIELPVWVPGAEKGRDAIFTPEEVRFCQDLSSFHNYTISDRLDGGRLFQAYLDFILEDRKGEFIQRATHFRTLKTVMSRFVFSLMKTGKIEIQLKQFCDVERSEHGYWLLSNLSIYSLETGLDQEAFGGGGDNIF